MIRHYILKGHEVEEIKVWNDGVMDHEALLEFGRAMQKTDNRVARTDVRDKQGNECYVSTVFLGLDHQFQPEGPPLIFETMVFGGTHDQWQERYSTWKEAEDGHARIVGMVS